MKMKLKRKNPQALPTNEIEETIYHRSCKTLTLDAFIEAYFNHNYEGLLISGTMDKEVHYAWNEILFNYGRLIKSETGDYLFQLSKDIALLQWHITYVNCSVVYLEKKYDQDIANELRNLGYIVPEPTDENYHEGLNRITSLAKRIVFEHGNLVDEFNSLSNIKKGKRQSEEEFISTVVMLSKYQGYAIDRKTTTVFDFVQIFNNYLTEMTVRQKLPI